MPLFEMFNKEPSFSLTGLSFLYVFLPLLLAGYIVLPKGWRAGFLLVVSVGYYLLVGAKPSALGLMAWSAALDYGAVWVLGQLGEDRRSLRRAVLWASLGKSTVLFAAVGFWSRQQTIPLLLGVVVVILSGMGAVAEGYRHETGDKVNPITFALYLFFFPRLHFGPFCTYKHFAGQLAEPKTGKSAMLTAFGGYLAGAFKALVLGGGLAGIYSQLRGFGPEEATILSHWLALLCFAMALYFLLAGFCEMARGLALLLGIALPSGFYYPYQSRNITDFSQRFQATLGQLLRRYLFPADGKAVHPPGNVCFAVLWGAILGLSFGFRLNYLLWGLYLAAFLLLENYVYPRVLAAIPVFLGRVYAFTVVLLGFTLLAGDSLGETFAIWQGLLGLGATGDGWINDNLLYLLDSNWLLLGAGAVLCTSLADVAGRWLEHILPRASRVGYVLVSGVVLVLYTALSF